MGYQVCQDLRYICTRTFAMPDELGFDVDTEVPIVEQFCGDIYENADEARRSFINHFNSRPSSYYTYGLYSQYECSKGEPAGEIAYYEVEPEKSLWEWITELVTVESDSDCGSWCVRD